MLKLRQAVLPCSGMRRVVAIALAFPRGHLHTKQNKGSYFGTIGPPCALVADTQRTP